MVMAGNENMPESLVEDTLSTRLQWLRRRRDALQEKLIQKNNELKNLCIEEAELTGALPPEIPLEPGETPPPFRRRVGTTFAYPQNLINKLKSNEAEESALELERQVQIRIVEAALGIVNDPTESKAVRRKHRLIYQQNQRKLQELDARLNFIRQSRGKPQRSMQLQHSANCNPQLHVNLPIKHRTKKPRPPLDNTGTDGGTKPIRDIIQEGGINVSPLTHEQKCILHPIHTYEEQLTSTSCNHSSIVQSTDQRQNVKIIEHDHNDNHNIYILPDQYRNRTYSHGSNGSRSHNHYIDSERVYRPIPNVYSEEEFHVDYRQLAQHQHQKHQIQDQIHNHQQYVDYKQLDNDTQRRLGQGLYDRDIRILHHTHLPDHQSYGKNSQSHSMQKRDRDIPGNKILRHTDTTADMHLSPGYWMRYDDEIIWCADDKILPDRFGSLDRRKCNAIQCSANINPDSQSRYRTVAIGATKSPCIGNQQHVINHMLPLTDQSPGGNKMLLRTQSLGSVETWHASQSHEFPEGRDTTDYVNRKQREKEWYETSVDSGTSPGLDLALLTPHRKLHCQLIPPLTHAATVAASSEAVKENYTTPLNQKTDMITENLQHLSSTQTRYEQSRLKILEIPAESKSCQEANVDAIHLGSPQNCRIVQAGKYQPYREVTKPFEMSDFYKYSTKYRKKNEATANQSSLHDPQQECRPVECIDSSELYRESNHSTVTNGTVTSPVQKKIYQPVQRMTCQPYLASLR